MEGPVPGTGLGSTSIAADASWWADPVGQPSLGARLAVLLASTSVRSMRMNAA
jgi:phage gp46-like protein